MADKFFMITDNLIQIIGLKDKQTGNYENAAAITVSIFKQATRSFDQPYLTFTSGGTYEIIPGDAVTGSVGSAWGVVETIVLTSGAWAAGDAAGRLYLSSQYGVFEAENLKVGIETDVASIIADSTGGKAISAAAGAKTQLPIESHGLPSDVKIRIEGTDNYDGEMVIDSVDSADLITINTAYAAEVFSSKELLYVGIINGTGISLDYVTDSDGNYEGILPSTLEGIVFNGYYYVFINIVKGANKKTYRLEWQADFASKGD